MSESHIYIYMWRRSRRTSAGEKSLYTCGVDLSVHLAIPLRNRIYICGVDLGVHHFCSCPSIVCMPRRALGPVFLPLIRRRPGVHLKLLRRVSPGRSPASGLLFPYSFSFKTRRKLVRKPPDPPVSFLLTVFPYSFLKTIRQSIRSRGWSIMSA